MDAKEFQDRFGDKIEKSIKLSEETGRETGFAICGGNRPSDIIIGSKKEIMMGNACKDNETIGRFHTHPPARKESFFSPRDIKLFLMSEREFDCINWKRNGVQCYQKTDKTRELMRKKRERSEKIRRCIKKGTPSKKCIKMFPRITTSDLENSLDFTVSKEKK